MAFLLARSSALQWLRGQGPDAVELKRLGLRVLDIEADYVRIVRHKATLSSIDKPVHLLVSYRDARRRSKAICCHLMQLPTGIYPVFMIERALFCSAPELLMIEMATTLDSDELLFLGYELCGSYGFDEQGELTDRGLICNASIIGEFARKCEGVHGRKRLAAVVPHVLDGSASPMETALAICLTMPVSKGGLGLPQPLLNHPLPVDGPAARIWDGKSITPDLLWPFDESDERTQVGIEAASRSIGSDRSGREEAQTGADGACKGVAIEYDSDENHTGGQRIARDSRRRNVLEMMGYRVIAVTNEQFADPREFERIGVLLAHYLDVPFKEAVDEAWVARSTFHAKIRGIALNPDRLLGG